MQHLANKIRTLRAKIDETGETRLEELKKHYDAIEDLIEDYSKKPDNYFTRVEMIKKLNRIALKVQEAYANKNIKAEIEVFDKALLALKKFRFKKAGEALQELKPVISIGEEHALLLSEYRKKYNALQNRKLDLLEKKLEIEKKQSLFKAETCSEAQYADFKTKLQSYNTSTAELLSDFIGKSQSRKAISTMLDIYGNPELALPPPPRQAEALKQFLAKNEIGRATISQLIDMSRYSRDRLQYYLDDVKAFLETIGPNLPWLESLNGLKCAAALQIDLNISADDLKIRIPRLVSAISAIANYLEVNCEAQINFLRALRKAAINGSFERIRAKHFQKNIDASAVIRSVEELKSLKEEIVSIEKLLSTLPHSSEVDII